MVWLSRLIINQLITRCTRRLVLRRLGAPAGAAARPRRARALGAAAAAAAPAALCCASASANAPPRLPSMPYAAWVREKVLRKIVGGRGRDDRDGGWKVTSTAVAKDK